MTRLRIVYRSPDWRVVVDCTKEFLRYLIGAAFGAPLRHAIIYNNSAIFCVQLDSRALGLVNIHPSYGRRHEKSCTQARSPWRLQDFPCRLTSCVK